MNHNDSFAKLFGEFGVQQILNTNLTKMEQPAVIGPLTITHEAKYMVPITYMTSDTDTILKVLHYYQGITEEIITKIQDQALAEVPGLKIDPTMAKGIIDAQIRMYSEALQGGTPYGFNINAERPQDQPNFLGDKFVAFETVMCVATGDLPADCKMSAMTWFVVASAMIRDPHDPTKHIKGGILGRNY